MKNLNTDSICFELRQEFLKVYDGNIFIEDRPSILNKDVSNFIIIRSNGGTSPLIAGNKAVAGKCVIMVEIYTRDKNGYKDILKTDAIRQDVIDNLLPLKTENYYFTYRTEVGSRDKVGFHSQIINLNCTI